jgi:hypothetical protein
MNEANEVVGEEQVIDDSSNPFEEPIQQEYQGDVPTSQSLENETYQVNWESEEQP